MKKVREPLFIGVRCWGVVRLIQSRRGLRIKYIHRFVFVVCTAVEMGFAVEIHNVVSDRAGKGLFTPLNLSAAAAVLKRRGWVDVQRTCKYGILSSQPRSRHCFTTVGVTRTILTLENETPSL